jgi:hypothetical protein
MEIEFDIYLPKEKLAIEYQGESHFKDIYSYGNRWRQNQRDEEKRKICLENEITLIEIPYWWDWKQSSLIATIRTKRQDLLISYKDNQGIPISSQSPKYVLNGRIVKTFT